jgi:hypothetical protein
VAEDCDEEGIVEAFGGNNKKGSLLTAISTMIARQMTILEQMESGLTKFEELVAHSKQSDPVI